VRLEHSGRHKRRVAGAGRNYQLRRKLLRFFEFGVGGHLQQSGAPSRLPRHCNRILWPVRGIQRCCGLGHLHRRRGGDRKGGQIKFGLLFCFSFASGIALAIPSAKTRGPSGTGCRNYKRPTQVGRAFSCYRRGEIQVCRRSCSSKAKSKARSTTMS
jgi:hypothetical protein